MLIKLTTSNNNEKEKSSTGDPLLTEVNNKWAHSMQHPNFTSQVNLYTVKAFGVQKLTQFVTSRFA